MKATAESRRRRRRNSLGEGVLWSTLLLAAVLTPALGSAQVLRLAEMTVPEIQALDRSRTVILMPGGPLEQHGPHLPAFTDGYVNERHTHEIAEAIAARPGWTAVLFPVLPLGVGGANELGGKMIFPGSYGVREATLRAVYMDLATQLGEQGFRWIFVMQAHGSPLHHRALDAAVDYFRDEFGGVMANLDGLLLPAELEKRLHAAYPRPLTEMERRENGVDAHAGWSETSRMLWVRPDLVRPIYRSMPSLAGSSLQALTAIAQAPDWPGYFGAPRLATAAAGAAEMRRLGYVDLALAILDGLDPATLRRASAEMLADPAEAETARRSEVRDREISERQRRWTTGRKP